jgi:hypothetical protein
MLSSRVKPFIERRPQLIGALSGFSLFALFEKIERIAREQGAI